MTPARASKIRIQRIEGSQLPNREKRTIASQAKWTIDRIWNEYEGQKENSKSFRTDKGRYTRYLRRVFGDKEPRELIQLDVDRQRIFLLKRKSP